MADTRVARDVGDLIRLDAATVLLQWSVGGLLFLWVTTRHRTVGLGYGWLLRGVFGILAAGAVGASRFTEVVAVREAASFGVVAATIAALGVSVARRAGGVRGQRDETARKRARVGAMSGAVAGVTAVRGGADTADGVGMDLAAGTLAGVAAEPAVASTIDGAEPATASVEMRDQFGRAVGPASTPRDAGGVAEFPPILDLIAPALGLVGLVAAGWAGGGSHPLAVARTIVGALFLGAVTDAMLLGHWYLVQPGLSRRPIGELNDWLMRIWPIEVGLLLVPTGMISVLNGSISDHYGGMLGWFWVACALTTLGLTFVTRAALKERFYSAVMAATGLLYLAILTAFGTDLVARAILSG